ncbi:uncharacterized protein LTR77_008231 [Saxophila tyrrhenica]|uniref:Uncharacterized protein n=1 Tax=Saxophila tyrrhenica TaxID=1690608 RepID=A0AAV9P308_9PEZI|nr:hypothetical protein LTR77_008231 [Saxophila tyrrhenica]
MHFIYPALVAIQASSAMAWQVIAYDNVENCAADSSTTYRFYESTGDPAYGFCSTWGAPQPGVHCHEYRNGGEDGPFDCNGDFTDSPQSVDFHPETKRSSGRIALGSFESYATVDCNDNTISLDPDGGETFNRCYNEGVERFGSWSVHDNGISDY